MDNRQDSFGTHDPYLYSQLMEMFSRKSAECSVALQLFDSMPERGVKPDLVVFNAAINAAGEQPSRMCMMHKLVLSVLQQTLFVMAALVVKKSVLTINCPYPEESLQSECSDWFTMALSLHQECPYIEHPYKES